MPNIQFNCPHCNQSIERPMEMLGQLMECPSCDETVEVQKQRKPKAVVPSLPRPVPKLKMPRSPKKFRKPLKGKEYKVLTPKDKWFDGNYELEKLEGAINFYAAKGWYVISVTTNNPEEILVVMGRNK